MSIILSLEDTKKIIEEIARLDLTSVTKDEILLYFEKIQNHVSIIQIVPAGTIVCRSVPDYLPDGRFPKTVQEMSYNPHLDQCRYNRANWEGESVFYGSISADFLRSNDTSGFEIISLDKRESKICREIVFIGKWVVQKDLEVVSIGGSSSLLNKTNMSKSRHKLLIDYITKIPEHELSLKLIDTFLCNEFSKDVPDDKRFLYKISAGYADYLKANGFNGLLYPSVRSLGAGLNIALFPNAIDSGLIRFEYASASNFYKRDKNIINEYVMEAYPDNEKLIWKEIYKYKLPPKIKAFYIGKSDDDSFSKYIPMTDLGSGAQ
ncbi:MAG: RES family NAD+ phosphorylase [Mucilaginibacter sp.]